MNHSALSTLTLTACVALAGCATSASRPLASHNPPPSEAFARFDAFELKPLNQSEGCDRQHGAEVALRELREQLNVELGSLVANWNRNAGKNAAPRTLSIEPVCTEARLVGIQGRIWGGAMAGDSFISLKVRYTDSSSGKVIAEPMFYQHAGGVGAAWSFGASDRSMVSRVVALVTDYTTSNRHTPVGGRTGS